MQQSQNLLIKRAREMFQKSRFSEDSLTKKGHHEMMESFAARWKNET